MKKKFYFIKWFFCEWSEIGFWYALNDLIHNFQSTKYLPFSPEMELADCKWHERNAMIHDYYTELLSKK